MTRLGQLLVRADLVSENQLARALGVQHFAGGRIGTLLLERGSLHEDDLGRILAEQHACEYVPWAKLADVPPAAIAALPAKFAIRHSAVPWDRGEGFLKIAMRDPSDLRILDELFFVTGRKVIPCAAPEVRIYQALEKYYGERRTPRFAILAEKLSRIAARPVAKSVPPPPPPDFFPEEKPLPGLAPPPPRAVAPDVPGEPRPAIHVPDLPVTPWAPIAAAPPAPAEAEEEEVISWEELSPPSLWIPEPLARAKEVAAASVPPPPQPAAVAPPPPLAPPETPRSAPPRPSPPESRRPEPAAAPPSPPAPPERPRPASSPPPATRLAPETFDFPAVLAARNRELVIAETLVALRERFPRVAVFGSRPDGVAGLAGAGARVNADKVPAIAIPWSDPSLFLNVRLSKAFYLGPLPPLPRHRAIAEATGGWSEECVVQPVWIKDKPVAFLYAEFDADRGATPMDLAYLRGLSAATANALAASIRSKRGA